MSLVLLPDDIAGIKALAGKFGGGAAHRSIATSIN